MSEEMKMSSENIGHCLHELSGYDSDDIDCDDFDVAVNDDQFAIMSIVHLAKLAADNHDQNQETIAKQAEEIENLRGQLADLQPIASQACQWKDAHSDAMVKHKQQAERIESQLKLLDIPDCIIEKAKRLLQKDDE